MINTHRGGLFLFMAIGLSACGGGGGDGTPAASGQPGNVAGAWSTPNLTNANTTRTANCSDPTDNGLTGQQALSDCRVGLNAFNLQTPPSGPTIQVTQNGDAFTIQRVNYVCLDRNNSALVDSAGFMTGSGTLSGSSITSLDMTLEDHDVNIVGNSVQDTGVILGHETDHFTGSVSGNTITLQLRAVSFAPTAAGTAAGLGGGSCGFDPPATFTSTVTH